MQDYVELPTVTHVTQLLRQLCELGTEADARQFLVRRALELCGCNAAGYGRLTQSGGLEFTWAGPDDVLEPMTKVLTEVEEAPAHAALTRAEPVVSPDLAEERRWPDYVTALVRHTPIRSVQAQPLRLAGTDIGVLVLYSAHSGYFATERCQPGAMLADHAAIGLSLLASRHQAEHLTLALQNSREIGQAMGIIMATHKVTADKAFDLLRTASQHGHRKLRDVAHEVTLTGQLPANESQHSGPTVKPLVRNHSL